MARCLLSSSLSVDFGPVLNVERNGSTAAMAPYARHRRHRKTVTPLATTAPEHQSILVTSVWMTTGRSQLRQAEVKRILYYTTQDLGLGQFLLESCFNASLKIAGERRSVLDITQMFSHHEGRLSINVVKMDPQSVNDLETGYRGGGGGGNGDDATDDDDNYYYESGVVPSPQSSSSSAASSSSDYSSNGIVAGQQQQQQQQQQHIRMWSYCKRCRRVVAPAVFMSDDTWKLSFGKFLEV